jgi:hypothetical protein
MGSHSSRDQRFADVLTNPLIRDGSLRAPENRHLQNELSIARRINGGGNSACVKSRSGTNANDYSCNEDVRARILHFTRTRHAGFNDHFPCEKLREVEGFLRDHETPRRLLISALREHKEGCATRL